MKRLLYLLIAAGICAMLCCSGCDITETGEAHKMLVSPAWLDTLIKGGNPGKAGIPSTYPGNGFVILDLDTWVDERIPGAIKISWLAFNKEENKNPSTPDGGNLKNPEDMKALLEGLGIDYNTTVIIYSSWATLYGKVAWNLMCIGIEDIRVLHGGLTAWKNNGGEVTSDVTAPTPIEYSETIPDLVLSKFNATTDNMVSYMNDTSTSLMLDTRTWDEFIGADDYHTYISTPGRIPNSKYYPYLNMLEGGVDGEDPFLKDFGEVDDEIQTLGATMDKTIAFVCTIGQRSGFACWYLYMMGYTNVRNYDAGWCEWIQDNSRPVDVGEP